MKIAVKENKRGNIAAMRKRLKTVSQRRGVDKTKSFCVPGIKIQPLMQSMLINVRLTPFPY